MNRITTKSNDQTDISEYPAKNYIQKQRVGMLVISKSPPSAFGYILYTKDNSVISESSSYFYLNRSKDLTISSSCIIPLKAK